MQIRQLAYFALMSEELSSNAIALRVGMVPDNSIVMASKRADPPIPAAHRWEVHAKPGGTVNEMVAELMKRVRPCAEEIRALVSDGVVSAVLQIVRYLDDAEGENERPIHVEGHRLGAGLSHHQLLGFHFDAETLRFIANTGIEIDIDEYG